MHTYLPWYLPKYLQSKYLGRYISVVNIGPQLQVACVTCDWSRLAETDKLGMHIGIPGSECSQSSLEGAVGLLTRGCQVT